MFRKIFISYRRGDSAGHAGRVEDRLAHEFGHNLLFMDVDSIPLGLDFVKVLREEVIKCDVLLAVIGPHWLDVRDAEGNRRLDDENDFVRIEVATALQRDIPVIPILLDGSTIPKPEQLPPDLQSLSLRNGLDVRHGSFHTDMDRLIGALKARAQTADGISAGKIEPPKVRSASTLRAVPWIGGILVSAGLGTAAFWLLSSPQFRAKAPTPLQTVNTQTMQPQAQATPAPAVATIPAATVVPVAPTISPSPSSSVPNAPLSAPTSAKLSPIKLGALTAGIERAMQPGDSFQECTACPVMTVIAPGGFIMGSPSTELGRRDSEGPQHQVTIAQKFALGRFSVSFDEWDACVADGGCNGYAPGDEGWGRGELPVVNVSWNEAKSYLAWLSRMTTKAYRLPTEAEREYAARAGTTTPFWWGSSITTEKANYNGNSAYGPDGVRGEFRGQSVLIGSFLPNPWGLFQMHGNVSEWTEDCWHDNYNGAPIDGSAWTSPDCKERVRRGGSIGSPPEVLRAASRLPGPQAKRQPFIGLRVVRQLSN